MMRYSEIENKNDYYDWSKDDNCQIWWLDPIHRIGEYLFSFDKEIVFSFFPDFPQKLTKEQIEIFVKEEPMLAELKGF